MPEDEPLEVAEQRALADFASRLRRHLIVASAAFDVAGAALSGLAERPIREVPQSLKATADLLIRLANDLRALVLLAERGYAIQAAAVAASIYEVALTIVIIDADDGIAQTWIDHDDPTRPFRSTRDLTREALTALGITDDEASQRLYRVYRQLCLAKHANPILETQHGFQLIGPDIVGATGPDVSEPAERAAAFALLHGVALAVTAIQAFVTAHVPEAQRPQLLEMLKAVMARRQELNQIAVERWRSDDPFPGRW